MSKKKYWINVEELENTNDVVAETPEFVNDPFEEALKDTSKTNRRDFLKVLGFSVTSAAVLNACTKTPVRYALPYVNKPQEVSPSVSNYYASTFFDGLEYNSILVRTVEGRPVKIEGNPDSPITMGGVSARGQAFVLNLYDNERLKAPMKSGSAIEWKQADTEILQKLTQIRNAGGKVRVLTSSVISPASQALINDFLGSFPEGSGKHIAYDSISASGILEANERAFGIKAVPHYRFDNAMVIVGFNADFLGTWLSPTEYTVQYSQNRKVTGDLKISRHIQFESNLSLTGANADLRVPMKPSQEGACILKLYNEIAAATGKPTLGGGSELAGNSIAAAARDLLKAQGKALVVSGSNNPEIQLLVNGINEMLGSYGSTIDMDHPSKLRQGTDAGIAELLNEMNSGSVDALLIYDANPVLTYPGGDSFATALKKSGFDNLIC
jgi:molybdopterin-containing oxidoreductase family iron-sulfur binding subunit